MIKINLKSLLKERDMTLTDLSHISGISLRALSALQNRKTDGIKYSTLIKICEALNIDISDLMTYEKEFNIKLITNNFDDKNGMYSFNIIINRYNKKYALTISLIQKSENYFDVYDFNLNDIPDELKKMFVYDDIEVNDLPIYEIISYLFAEKLLNIFKDRGNTFQEERLIFDYKNILPRYIMTKIDFNIAMYDRFDSSRFYIKRLYEVPITIDHKIPYNALLSNRLVDRINKDDEEAINYLEIIGKRAFC